MPTAFNVATRPLGNGDTYSYSGTTLTTTISTTSVPNPTSTSAAAVTQNVNVIGGATFNGQTNLFDVKTSETDTTPLQQSMIVTDAYYQAVASGTGTNLVSWGYASLDSFGEGLNVQYGASGAASILLDRLPEVAGDSWTNGPGQRLSETSSTTNQTSQRTYFDNGTYSDTTNYPSGSLAGAAAALTSSITENADGSGTYSFPHGATPNTVLTFSAPDVVGNIAIKIVLSSGGVLNRTSQKWYSLPLYSESDRNNGSTAIPGACNVPPSFGATANALVQTTTRVDTVLGTVESISRTSYTLPLFGPVCVQLSDVLKSFYDYSGAVSSSFTNGTAIFGGGTIPNTTQTVMTTLGLVSTSVKISARTRSTQSVAARSWVVENASSIFALGAERRRNERQRQLFETVRRIATGKGVPQ
ncbi:MAG: hypothetical protein GIW95_00070 [Candidatus Eremiobacteraeota bacterium]|nr:hypothetical protein [Candidatus Eremiobacteraeota bacterium]